MSIITKNAQARKRQRIINFIGAVIAIAHNYRQQTQREFAKLDEAIAEIRKKPCNKRSMQELQRTGAMLVKQKDQTDTIEKLERLADYWHFGILHQVANEEDFADFSVANMMRDIYVHGLDGVMVNMGAEIAIAERNELNR